MSRSAADSISQTFARVPRPRPEVSFEENRVVDHGPRHHEGARVVIAHDYLTQRGGAERVVVALTRAFPEARLVTSIYSPSGTYPEFKELEIQTSPLSRISALRSDPRRSFPLLAAAWRRTVINDAEVVICSSSGWAHGVTTAAVKIVYCHNPARWLYQPGDYMKGQGLVARAALRAMRSPLRRWDRTAAASADRYLANSSVVGQRIEKVYGRTARVVHPPVTLPEVQPEPVPGLQPGFLMTVGRPRGYKNTDLVAAAVTSLPDERLVVVGGLPAGNWARRVTGLDDVSDAQLRWLYKNASAVIACAHEDFGLTPIEGYSMGTPALALRAGGYLDTTVQGITGEFVEHLSVAAIAEGIRRLRSRSYDAAEIRRHAERFSQASFARTMRDVIQEAVDSRARSVGGVTPAPAIR